jgi:hypothetical protein
MTALRPPPPLLHTMPAAAKSYAGRAVETVGVLQSGSSLRLAALPGARVLGARCPLFARS